MVSAERKACTATLPLKPGQVMQKLPIGKHLNVVYTPADVVSLSNI